MPHHSSNRALCRPVLIACAALLLAAPACAQQDGGAPGDGSWHLTGDIGAGLNAAPVPARGQSRQPDAIPYLNFDAGPLFARIDTFGVKLLPVGAGSVELLTRVLSDGYLPRGDAAGAQRRRDSVPVGFGTLQVTPVGAFMFNIYHDPGASGGNLADAMYVAELDAGPVALYAQAGVEYRSSGYVRYFDGTSSSRAGAASSPFAALFAEVHIGGPWYINGNLHRSWLGSAIRNSALVRRATLDSGLLALSYRFD